MSPPEAQSVSDPLPGFELNVHSSGRETCRLSADSHEVMELKGMHPSTHTGKGDDIKAEGSGWNRERTLCFIGNFKDMASTVHVTDNLVKKYSALDLLHLGTTPASPLPLPCPHFVRLNRHDLQS